MTTTCIVGRGIAVAALAAVVTGGVVAGSATAATPHAKHTSALTFVVGGTDDKHSVAVLHGGITDAGKDTSPTDAYDLVTFAHGSIRFNHPDKQEHFTYKVDQKTCYATFRTTGTGTLSNGTGIYRGYTGKATYTGSGTYILTRTAKGACDMNSEGTGLFVVHGSGTVTH